MKFLDLFAGIGGFRLGMESAGHKCVGFCEIDKFARTSYKAIHDTEGEVEMHDITTVSDEFIRGIGSVDVVCGGFPCQAFSIAGKRKGFEDTRGTLFFEIARFASILRPRYLFLENVKGLLNHEGGATFETILRTLDELGYDVEWQVLNSKDYVPQNRERVFIIGHLRGECTRKIFPFSGNDEPLVELQRQQSSVNTITARYGEAAGVGSYVVESKQQEQVAIPAQDRQGIIVVGNLPGNHDQNSRVYNSRGIAPTLSTMQGGGQEPKILIKEATTKGYAEALPGDSVNISHPNSETRRGRVGKGIANTLLTGEEQAVVTDNYRIRKLTPRECWRLQGFPDWSFDRAKEVNSDSQLYKQAGNSVTVPVIADIAKRL
ncbi:DNA (cytosine-5-)-methyltransferase [Enterococcus lactis]|uniref:DNA cytosine methyltransferase n=1 Tax=Enterococcus TaxID=1350 RepID=UPI001867A08A|nr:MULTISPECIES: DNA (cytosine-5-)-methyltransferase [Enterococcus]MBE2902463.1 DNA (cytosine-5-)-methyltransferase [Enterococcus faecium]MDT2780095.1 DNA (cytosine-5-)-methyltransferase [Enterococcus lactis]